MKLAIFRNPKDIKSRKPLSSQTISKNRAFLVVLLLLVALFFGLSIVRMKENIRVQETPSIRLHK